MACLMAEQLGIFLLLAAVLFPRFHRTMPYLAGASLLPCALKPHLFLPLAVAMLLWSFHRKNYRVLAGFFIALLAGCGLTLCLDTLVWAQCLHMMNKVRLMDYYAPTMSLTLRALIDPSAKWMGFVPEGAACLWAAWYFWTRRDRWEWMKHGLLVLLVSVACEPSHVSHIDG